jgi:hypothetical protein
LRGGAAVGAETAIVEATVIAIGHLGLVEILAALFELATSSLKEVDVDAFIGEAYGEDEAGDAAPMTQAVVWKIDPAGV